MKIRTTFRISITLHTGWCDRMLPASLRRAKKVLPDDANKTGYHSGTCILYLQIRSDLVNRGILDSC